MVSNCECGGELEVVEHGDKFDFVCEDCGNIIGGGEIEEELEESEEGITEDEV